MYHMTECREHAVSWPTIQMRKEAGIIKTLAQSQNAVKATILA